MIHFMSLQNFHPVPYHTTGPSHFTHLMYGLMTESKSLRSSFCGGVEYFWMIFLNAANMAMQRALEP